MSLGRIYVRFGKDYDSMYDRFDNFDCLLEAVARSVRSANGKPLIKHVYGKEIVCLAQTKKFIAKEATNIIKQINRVYTGDHMALYASKTQINRLIGVCQHEKHSLSCYAFIVLHVIYININKVELDDFHGDFDTLRRLIYTLGNEFIRHHEHDDLAHYIVNCYLPVQQEMTDGVICQATNFPDIHRWF